MRWFAVRFGPPSFGIHDAFPDDSGRQIHLSGEVAHALEDNTGVLFPPPPTDDRAGRRDRRRAARLIRTHVTTGKGGKRPGLCRFAPWRGGPRRPFKSAHSEVAPPRGGRCGRQRRAGEASPVHDHNGLQVIVEAPIPAVRLIRVAGRLDQAAAASVLRLVAVQLDLIAGRHQAVTDLVLDIEQVRCFEPGGLESLRHAPYTAGQRGIGVCLSGCQGRVAQLPLRARRLLSGFRTFPTAEVALQMLITGTSATSTVERGAHVPDLAGPRLDLPRPTRPHARARPPT